MKKMKLFPKTFLYTFFMLLFITTSMHLMIYFFYPKVYLSRMQDQLEKKMETLQQEIKRNTAAEAGQIFSDFAKQNNVNVTVECAGSEVTYMGMDFQISLYTDADMVFDVSNLENAESIIVKNKTMEERSCPRIPGRSGSIRGRGPRAIPSGACWRNAGTRAGTWRPVGGARHRTSCRP